MLTLVNKNVHILVNKIDSQWYNVPKTVTTCINLPQFVSEFIGVRVDFFVTLPCLEGEVSHLGRSPKVPPFSCTGILEFAKLERTWHVFSAQERL